ncbi:DUF402 domain-containing protein [Terrilactibacillus sp. S3-3]|nr:DUF402 domain-containing protein [Terrilactibacillus sp. S3-3]
MTYREGCGTDGVLWFDDLYLDVILFPNHDVYLVDEDELAAALEKGIITAGMSDLAWESAGRLMDSIKRDPEHLALARSLRQAFNE